MGIKNMKNKRAITGLIYLGLMLLVRTLNNNFNLEVITLLGFYYLIIKD